MTGDFLGIDKALAAFRLSSFQWSVHLARHQAAQVIAFHHQLASESPGLLSRMDVRRGDAMARVMAYVCRLAYVWVGHRVGLGSRPCPTR